MKKLFFISLATVSMFAIVFSSCNSNKTSTSETEINSESITNTTNDSSKADGISALVSENATRHLTVEEFDKVINDNKLTMVDLYTTWCGPCKMMAPFVAELRQELLGSVNIIKVDAEEQLEISQRYNLEGYPTLIFFKNGSIVKRQLGGMDKEGLLQLINETK